MGRKLRPVSGLWPLSAQQPKPYQSHTAEVSDGCGTRARCRWVFYCVKQGAWVLCCHQTQYVSSSTELLRARTTSLLISWAVLQDFTALKVSHCWYWEHQWKMWKPSTGRSRKADSSWSQHPHGIGLQALVMCLFNICLWSSIFHHHGHTYIISLLTYYTHLPLHPSPSNSLSFYYQYEFQSENQTVLVRCLKLFHNLRGPELKCCVFFFVFLLFYRP